VGYYRLRGERVDGNDRIRVDVTYDRDVSAENQRFDKPAENAYTAATADRPWDFDHMAPQGTAVLRYVLFIHINVNSFLITPGTKRLREGMVLSIQEVWVLYHEMWYNQTKAHKKTHIFEGKGNNECITFFPWRQGL